MAAVERPVVKPRPIYLNLMAIRQPLPAIVSILHRISGALLFAVGIPLLLWFVQTSLASGAGFAAAFGHLSSWFGKLVERRASSSVNTVTGDTVKAPMQATV